MLANVLGGARVIEGVGCGGEGRRLARLSFAVMRQFVFDGTQHRDRAFVFFIDIAEIDDQTNILQI